MERFKTSNHQILANDDDSESLLSLYKDENNDRNFFNLIDQEMIKLAGSKVLLYKYIPSDDKDDIYMESRQKAVEVEPVILYSQYDPRPLEEIGGQFGIEVSNDQTFVFNKSYVERKLGRSIIPGDILKSTFQNLKFEVFQVQEDSFESYGIYHLMVHAKLLRDTQDIHNEPMLNTTEPIGGKL